MEVSSQLYTSWLLDRSTYRLPQNTRLLLSELFWDYVDLSKNEELSTNIRISGKRNRWEPDISGKLHLRADERLQLHFVVHGRRVFAPGDPDRISRTFITCQ